MTNPLQTLRDALGEISIYATHARRPNLNRAIARAESALREVEAKPMARVTEIGPLPVDISWDADGADPRYTVEDVLEASDAAWFDSPECPRTKDDLIAETKRRLAERGEK